MLFTARHLWSVYHADLKWTENRFYHFSLASAFTFTCFCLKYHIHCSLSGVWNKINVDFFILAAEGDSHTTKSPQEQTNGSNGTVVNSNATVMITSATSVFLFVVMLFGVFIYVRKQKKKSALKGLNICLLTVYLLLLFSCIVIVPEKKWSLYLCACVCSMNMQ